jgi:hypothetical protein
MCLITGGAFVVRAVDALADVYEGRLQQMDKLYLSGISVAVRSVLEVLLFSVLLIKFDYASAKRVLYVLIPGAAILHLIYCTYQREFFSFCLTHSLISYLLWIMAKTYNPGLELAALVSILIICVAAFIFFLLASRHDGEGNFGPITVRLYENKKIKAPFVAALYGGTVLLAAAAYLLGAPYAYYIMYAMIGAIAGAAVYYTVKLI